MIEFLLPGLLLFVMASPFLALIAYIARRAGRSRRDAEDHRFRRLERRISLLEQELRAAGHEPLGEEESAAPDPEPKVVQPELREVPVPPEIWRAPAEPTPPEPVLRERAPAPSAEEPRDRRDLRDVVDWERWVGVRGTATVAGIALALGGIYLFKYAIEKGLITEQLRVGMGVLGGLVCLAGALFARKKTLRHIPGSLAGAGIVTLYASAWASHELYGLVPFGVSFAAMAVVTAIAVAMSILLRAQAVALLGLVGGFVTPLLLGADPNRPLPMFGYFLLLDIGLVTVGSRLRWPLLGLAGVGATFAYQLLWSLLHLDAGRMTFALVMVGTFAALFAVGGRWLPGQHGTSTRSAGLLLPFLLALHISTGELVPELWPTALLLALLVTGCAFVARDLGMPWLLHAGAGGVVAVVAGWLRPDAFDRARVWELAAVATGLALLFQVLAEWQRRRPRDEAQPLPIAAETIAAVGLMLLTVATATFGLVPPHAGPWPLLAGWVLIGAVLFRQAVFAPNAWPAIAGALATGTGLAFWGLANQRAPLFPGPAGFVGLALGTTALAHVGALLVARAIGRRTGEASFAPWAAAASIAIPLVASIAATRVIVLQPGLALGAVLALSLVLATAARTTRHAAWAILAVIACVAAQTPARLEVYRGGQPYSEEAFALTYLSVASFLALPLLLRARSSAGAMLWRAAAAAPVMWLFPLRSLHLAFTPELPIAVLPGILGAGALVVLALAQRGERESDMRRVATVWLSAVGVSLLAVAGPMQVDRHVVAVGAALLACAIAVLWRRVDHPGLKLLSFAGVVVSMLALLGSLAVPGRYPRGAGPVLDWVGYGALLPAVLAIVTSVILGAREVERLTTFERERVYGGSAPAAATVCGILGLLGVFVWINLEINDHFGTGAVVTFAIERHPARDLTTSIAWALYALVILGTGMVRGKTGLRWVSLGFLVLSLGKVFLHDLGELEGLHRVGSLVGLALSLLLVSVLYQRFVFRRSVESGDSPP